MPEFKSWRSYRCFEKSVKTKNRYVRNVDTDDFLDTVLATSKTRESPVSKGAIFWRSQLGHCWDPIYQGDHFIDEYSEGPFPPERMKPQRDMASEGRANPKGIPCLYLANNKETAMAEVRPWIGSLISVGRFKTVRDLILIDCSINYQPYTLYHYEEPDAETRERAVWSDIDRAFSKPVSPSDHVADYAPTQIIAELFKNKGRFDGIVYKSHLVEKGYNVVLFNLDAADLINCHLYEASAISFKFEECASPYFIEKG